MKPRTTISLLVLALVLCGQPVADDPLPRIPAMTPVEGYGPSPDESTATLAPDGSWGMLIGGYVIRLTPLGEEGRRAYIEGLTGHHVDPFATRDGQEQKFVTFLLEMANREKGVMVYQPQRTWMKTRNAQIHLPLDLPTMRSVYAMHTTDMPEAFAAAGRALFDGETTLNEGEGRSGLLVFEALDPWPKTIWSVEFPVTIGNGELVQFVAMYSSLDRLEKRRKKAEKKAEKAAKEAAENPGATDATEEQE